MIETAVVHLGHKSFTLLQRAVTTDTHEVKCECKTVMVGYDLATKEPKLISEDYKKAICRYEEKRWRNFQRVEMDGILAINS